MRKILLWTLIGGGVYYNIEGLWRLVFGNGWAHGSMIFVGGLCFVLIGAINQVPAFYHLSMRAQAVFGALIIMAVELAAGYVLNIRLGLGVWDYSHLPLNIAGQVCALFGLLWVLLVPFGVWLEDKLNLLWNDRYGVSYDEMYDYTLVQAYRELFLGKR